jgi:hypothetical protein
MSSPAYRHLCSWENLVLAWRGAARGKRGTASVARFEFRAEEHLAELQPRNGGWTALRVRPAWGLARHNEAE